MKDPTLRVRRGAHRTARDVVATVLPSLLAVAAVTSLVTALYVWRGEAVQPPRVAAAEASTTDRPTTHQPTTHQPTATAPAPTPPGPAETPAPAAEVVVLNQTGRSGLAASVAERLRSKGWTVSGVGDFHGVVPATTVYYPAGQQASARAAAKSLPTPARLRPRFGNLSTSRLTVVVTDSYPG